jgi:general secretion pathway protein C
MKKSAKNTRASKLAGPAAAAGEQRSKRPWMLILLGVVVCGSVLFVQLTGRGEPDQARPDEKVYSAGAESFEPMAVSSRQTGLLEPPGVAKPLHLFAVKVGSNAREGLAVLGAADASGRTYVAGALLENGARLTELYSDHVVLIRAGQRYTLYLPQQGKSDALGEKSSTGLTVGGFEPPPPPVTPPTVRVSDAIRVAPNYEDGQVVGFLVYPGAKAGQMERWGLVSGDVLLSLSGQPLNSAEQIESAMEQLAQGASIAGEVRRGQERLAVTLDGSMLMASAPGAPPPLAMP